MVISLPHYVNIEGFNLRFLKILRRRAHPAQYPTRKVLNCRYSAAALAINAFTAARICTKYFSSVLVDLVVHSKQISICKIICVGRSPCR